jgi:dephospho-CoA kinase
MNTLQLIGLAGTNGSGKDTVGKLLAEHHNYFFVSVSDLLRNEAIKRGWQPSRESTRTISAEWRREFGLGVLVDRAVDAYKETGDKYAGVVIANFRNPGEADRIHELGGTMVWVDADPRVRYERVQAGRAARGADRAVDDDKTFEQFLADEELEMHQQPGADAATLNTAAVKERCDVFLENKTNDFNDFLREIEAKLGL